MRAGKRRQIRAAKRKAGDEARTAEKAKPGPRPGTKKPDLADTTRRAMLAANEQARQAPDFPGQPCWWWDTVPAMLSTID